MPGSRCCDDGSHIFATAKRPLLEAEGAPGSAALLLLPPMAFLLPPMALLLPPMALLLPPMALLVDRCRSRSLKMKKAMACPRTVTRSTSPCTVRALQRRADRAGVVRPCRKACGCSSSASNTRVRARLLANGQIMHTHVFIMTRVHFCPQHWLLCHFGFVLVRVRVQMLDAAQVRVSPDLALCSCTWCVLSELGSL
jgi:hypothetical protein